MATKQWLFVAKMLYASQARVVMMYRSRIQTLANIHVIDLHIVQIAVLSLLPLGKYGSLIIHNASSHITRAVFSESIVFLEAEIYSKQPTQETVHVN